MNLPCLNKEEGKPSSVNVTSSSECHTKESTRIPTLVVRVESTFSDNKPHERHLVCRLMDLNKVKNKQISRPIFVPDLHEEI